jgi:hypothetical protein
VIHMPAGLGSRAVRARWLRERNHGAGPAATQGFPARCYQTKPVLADPGARRFEFTYFLHSA